MRIFIDCSNAHSTGLNTGIQRVVRAFSVHLPLVADASVQVQNVILRNNGFIPLTGFGAEAPAPRRRHPRQILNDLYLGTMRRLAGLTPHPRVKQFLLAHKSEFGLAYLLTAPLRPWQALKARRRHRPAPASLHFGPGDILFLCDGIWMHDAEHAINDAHQAGARIVPFIHDIIPLTHPEFCHPSFVQRFSHWLVWMLAQSEGLVFNSRYTRDSVARYIAQQHLNAPPPAQWRVVHLGADLPGAVADKLPARSALRKIFQESEPTYLCVGTLEQRKNQARVLDAFEQHWATGSQAKLLLIGRSGGLCHDLLARIKHHAQWGRQLFWLDGATDQELHHAYRQARALIFASLDEGFGLPLVEALRAGLETVCSDLPVFREIAGDHTTYFPPLNSTALAKILYHMEQAAPSPVTGFTWPEWQDSSRTLYQALSELSAS